MLTLSHQPVGSFALGLTLMISCLSNTTKDLYLYRIETSAFLTDYTVVNTTDNAQLQGLFNTADFNATTLALPETYYFGISGVCRKYNNSTDVVCSRSFPVSYDIPKTILSDLVTISNASLPSNFTATDVNSSNIESLSKVTAALLIVSMVFAFCTAIVVLIWPKRFVSHAVPLFILGAVTLCAWLIGNFIFLKQGVAYNLLGQPLGASNHDTVPGALGLGPGFGIFIGYLVCCLALTPVMAFWSAVAVLVLVTITVVLTIEIVLIALVCAAACAGGDGSQTKTEYTTYETYDNSGYYNDNDND